MWVLYGLKNCDSCRKARKWLQAEGIAHRFHDLREDGLAEPLAARWLAAVGSALLLNRRSTTWRGLTAAQRRALAPESSEVTEGAVIGLLLAHPTLIRRPVLDDGRRVHVGFDAASRAALTAAPPG